MHFFCFLNSFSFLSLLCPSSFYLSPGPHSCTPAPFTLKICLGLQVLWLASLCCSFVCPTAPASLCQHCGHDRALQPWNTQPTLPETPALGHWVEWDFKEKARIFLAEISEKGTDDHLELFTLTIIRIATVWSSTMWMPQIHVQCLQSLQPLFRYFLFYCVAE